MILGRDHFLAAISAGDSARAMMWSGVSELEFGDQEINIPAANEVPDE